MMQRVKSALSVVLVAGAAPFAALASMGAASAASVTPSCAATQLSVTIGRAQGTAGTTYYPIVFTNRGGTCAIWGVPAIQPVATGRRALGPMAHNTSVGMMPVRHVIKYGQAVSVAFGVVETGNYPAASCAPRRAVGVSVSLGSFLPATYRPLSITVCTLRASTTTRLLASGVNG
jgi:hypothetical protein